MWKLNLFKRQPKVVQSEHFLERRKNGAQAAVIFVHGFTSSVEEGWGAFIDLLLKEQSLTSWDVFSVGYSSKPRADLCRFWSSDPDLTKCSQALRTRFATEPIKGYSALAIVGHSMGGLIVQRALLDDPEIQKRSKYLFMFGTPSNGVRGAKRLASLKPQIRDMGEDSAFIQRLRDDWRDRFPNWLGISLLTIAGDQDEFVPASSSLDPFPQECRVVVNGNHIEMARPASVNHLGYRVVVDALNGGAGVTSIVDRARLAVEQREFASAVQALYPNRSELDDAALVALALALESIGRQDEALEILEQRYKGGVSSLDALGVLGGRLKRRWLVERRREDWQRAHELYSEGLSGAEAAQDFEQAYYHAINLAFLVAAQGTPGSAMPVEAQDMARAALAHSTRATENNWNIATQAEAHLLLGNQEEAVALYERAIDLTQSPRQVQSMYAQAITLGDRIGEGVTATIKAVFDPSEG